MPLPAPAGNDGIAWWWLIPAVLLGAGATAFALTRRRRERPVTAPAIERPRPASAAAHPEKAPEPPAPAPLPAAENRPIARHEAAGAPGPIQLELDTVRLSVTLVNATLQYRLRLTNASPATLGPIALGADMIAAHASLPVADQLAQGVGLELRHEIPPLAPGEQAEISGDLRLPLASVTPIRQGKATLLVPLVRLRAESDGVLLARAHVVGETPAVPGGPLRPFRLDQGPRIFGAISQRELPAAA